MKEMIKNLQKSPHDIQDCRLPDGGMLGLSRERGVASHEEVKVWCWDERCNESNQVVVHVRRIPAAALNAKALQYNTFLKGNFNLKANNSIVEQP